MANKLEISTPTRVRISFSIPYTGKFSIYRRTAKGVKLNYYRLFSQPKKDFFLNLYQTGIYIFPDLAEVAEVGPVKTRNIELPKPDRAGRIPNLNEFKFVGNSGLSTPARIYHQEKEIHTNAMFDRLPEQVQQAILFHEIGHFNYKNEKDCDKYSAHRLMQMGGNLSQLFYALELGCQKHKFNEERKKAILSY